MDNILEQLFTLPNIVFCLMIFVLVWIQRKGIRMLWKGAEKNKIWREVALPLGPICTGGILAAAIKNYPYPEDFQTLWARIFFGVVCGLASAHVYRILKKFLTNRSGAIDVTMLPRSDNSDDE